MEKQLSPSRLRPRVKEMWLKALRSGDYVQGEGRLYGTYEDGSKHCCLGVLCELYRQDTQSTGLDTDEPWKRVVKTGNGSKEHQDLVIYSFLGETGVLPENVQEWAGEAMTCNPRVSVLDEDNSETFEFEHLGTLNDNGYTFEEIAILIEEQM